MCLCDLRGEGLTCKMTLTLGRDGERKAAVWGNSADFSVV